MRKGKRVHVSASVGILESFAKQGKSFMDWEDGTPLTPEECLEAAKEFRAKGYEVVPPTGCDNYDKTGRCKGHPLKR